MFHVVMPRAMELKVVVSMINVSAGKALLDHDVIQRTSVQLIHVKMEVFSKNCYLR